MSLQIPNIDRISKQSPQLGEALLKVQNFTNSNVVPATGTAQKAPTFVNPAQRPG